MPPNKKSKTFKQELREAIAKEADNARILIQDEVADIYDVMRTNKSISGATFGSLRHHIGMIVKISNAVIEEAQLCARERDMHKEGGKLMKQEADKYKGILGEIEPDKSLIVIRKAFKKTLRKNVY